MYHRYIWEKENGKIPEGYIIHHKDEDKQNNNIDNLQMITKKIMSEAHKGKVSNRKGVKLSDETKKKMSTAAKNRWQTQHKEKQV